MTQATYQKLRGQLVYLELATAAERLPTLLESAKSGQAHAHAVSARIAGGRVSATEQRRLDSRLRMAGLPSPASLESFDYDAQPALDRRLVDELATLRFSEQKANALLIGPPGVGKTHIAIALARKAAEAGYRAFYTTAADLVAKTSRAALEGRWQTTMRFWNGPQLLVIDELGYLPLQADAAAHLFQVISRRYETGWIVLTTNRGIADWREIFEDTVVASAILDRLLHHATVIAINGNSYRMRRHHDHVNAIRPALISND